MGLFEKTKEQKLISYLKKMNLFPFFRTIQDATGANVTINNKNLVMMGSNNYLGLTHDIRVQKASSDAIFKWGTGCTGSRFLNGNLELHHQLEKSLKDFFGYEDALVFSSGFMTNQGTISSLIEENDFILSDKENHACIVDGCRLSGGEILVYRHNDMKDLEEKLSALPMNAGKLIVTDGVFSMTGRLAALKDIQKLASKYRARLMVDEAHGIGVTGIGGRGAASACGIKPDILMGTFSKALASQGGFICANKEVIEWVKLKARTMMFSAALSPASVAATHMALEILKEDPTMVETLNEKAAYLRSKLNHLGLDTLNSETSVISVRIGDDKTAFALSHLFEREGVFVTPVAYPAVDKGEACIRCSVILSHTYPELDVVVRAFQKNLKFIQQVKSDHSFAIHDFMSQGFSEDLMPEAAVSPSRF